MAYLFLALTIISEVIGAVASAIRMDLKNSYQAS